MKSVLARYQFRKMRVREKVFGTSERPRLSVYRSLKQIYAQIIDDTNGKTLAASSSLDKAIKTQTKGGNIKSATLIGKALAEKAKSAHIKKVVFDRGGRIYHGSIKALADAAREGGLEF